MPNHSAAFAVDSHTGSYATAQRVRVSDPEFGYGNEAGGSSHCRLALGAAPQSTADKNLLTRGVPRITVADQRGPGSEVGVDSSQVACICRVHCNVWLPGCRGTGGGGCLDV